MTLHQTTLQYSKLTATFDQTDAKSVSSPIAHGTLLIRLGPNDSVDDEEAARLQDSIRSVRVRFLSPLNCGKSPLLRVFIVSTS